MPQPVNFGPETLVNTGTALNQDGAAITALSATSFVVTWRDELGDGDGSVRGQLYSTAAGAPARVGAEFAVSAPAGGAQDQPAITALSATSFVATWHSAMDPFAWSPGDGLVGQVFDGDGSGTPTAVGGQFSLGNTPFNAKSDPVIAPLLGGFAVAWREAGGDASGSAIKAQVFASNGLSAPTANGAEFLVNTTQANDQNQPAITALSGTAFLVTWSDNSPASGEADVKGQLYDTSGGTAAPLGAEFLVNTATDSNQFASSVTALSPTSFVVTWTDENSGTGAAETFYDLKAQLFSTAGGGTPVKVGGEVAVNNEGFGVAAGTTIQDASSVIALSGTSFAVAWRSQTGDGDGYAIKARVFTTDGASAPAADGGEVLVNTATAGSQVDPVLARLTDRSLVAAWSDENGDGDGFGIKLQELVIDAAPQITSNGGAATAAVSVAENGTAVTTVTATDADGPGALTFAITGGADAAKFTINAATGALAFAAAPDFEAPGDAGGDNTYDVLVAASDGILADGQAIAVTVTNVGDPSPFADSILGTAGPDLIDALAGNDTVLGLAGDDTLLGNAGDDVLDGGAGADTLSGGSGDDTGYGGTGDDLLDLGAGADLLDGGIGGDTLSGGEGDDTLTAGDGADLLDGGAGDDTVYGGTGGDAGYGGDGNDFLDGGAGADFLDGGLGANTLVGGEGNDAIIAGDGADLIGGGVGDDTIYAGAGNDTAYGEDGNDFIDLGAGADFLVGGLGNDSLRGDDGTDYLDGGDGDDLAVGGAGSDTLVGGLGDDVLFGGDATLAGNAVDALFGGDGADRLFAGQGSTLYAQGGAGDDQLVGDSFADTLIGGAGRDYLVGGEGRDLFVLGSDAIEAGSFDTIADLAAGDLVQLSPEARGRTVMNTDGISTYLGVETAPGQFYVIAFAGVTDMALVQGSVFFA